ncbi:hypothetical protein ANN_01881 [Periplaneta americana]|uniref:Uncharacterized protein n=1 Tax=Periplaneta americana TaxID=6978 RepID=A0ABQ8TWD7_PERAM|nr:hypothetical protein ANN_01881 [Periplaneta americana]
MQRLEPDGKPKRVEFANTMLHRHGADPDFRGPIAWPPRSPDLTPLDFFLWSYIKDKVYATPVRDLRDLRERIIEAIESIPEDMLQRAWQEIVHRLDIVTVTAGTHNCKYLDKKASTLTGLVNDIRASEKINTFASAPISQFSCSVTNHLYRYNGQIIRVWLRKPVLQYDKSEIIFVRDRAYLFGFRTKPIRDLIDHGITNNRSHNRQPVIFTAIIDHDSH